jgi:hypothetical protein
MSEGHGARGHEHGEDVPISQGISPVMWVFLVFSILLVCMQGGFVIASSGMGHQWPAADSAKVQLPEPAR